MIESEATAAISNRDLKRARFWIQRWKQCGGSFLVSEHGDDIYTVDAVRQANPDPRLEKHYAKAQPELLKELERDRKKGETVTTLVIEAHVRGKTRGQAPSAQDNEPEPPAAA